MTNYHVAEYAPDPHTGFALRASEPHDGYVNAHDAATRYARVHKTVQIQPCTGTLTCACCRWEGQHPTADIADHDACCAERDAFSDILEHVTPRVPGWVVHPALDGNGGYLATFIDARYRETTLTDRWNTPTDACRALVATQPAFAPTLAHVTVLPKDAS